MPFARAQGVANQVAARGPAGAAFWIRGGARILDLVLIRVLVVAGSFLALFVLARFETQGSARDWAQSAGLGSPFEWVLSFLIMIFYFASSEYLAWTSPGKLIVGLRVLGQDGVPATLRGVIVRNAAMVIDGFAFGLVAYFCMRHSPQRQRLGDVWGETVVVRRTTPVLQVFERRRQLLLGLAVAVLGTPILMSIAIIVPNLHRLTRPAVQHQEEEAPAKGSRTRGVSGRRAHSHFGMVRESGL